VQKSNANAKVLGTLTAKFNPEFAGNIGVEGVDDLIQLAWAGAPHSAPKEVPLEYRSLC
jgi:hypothetical protein